MANSSPDLLHLKTISTAFIILSLLLPGSVSVAPEECGKESESECVNRSKAQPLKIIAIVTILATSLVGVCVPLATRSIPALQPDRDLFIIIKSFAAGIILATGFMHVLPDSFEMLSSECLDENPWHKFPFTGFVAMLSAIGTLMADSFATSFYSNKKISTTGVVEVESAGDREMGVTGAQHFHGHGLKTNDATTMDSQLLRYRVVAMVLELGIVVHSVVIGLSLGASGNVCTIKGLVAALCFHQLFEGMGLGGCILQANFKRMKNVVLVFFFSATTPFGIVLGMLLSTVYRDNSPTSLITEGVLNASSAGLLIYMALVDILAAEFMGPKLQGSVKLQIKSYAAALLGVGGMSLMAKWA